ncbi:MAG: hypothetical protein HUJ74_01735 [Lachnospiraceae bacterium]|nr:hypothetical protein [Lachnospiraceae bacterium]
MRNPVENLFFALLQKINEQIISEVLGANWVLFNLTLDCSCIVVDLFNRKKV